VQSLLLASRKLTPRIGSEIETDVATLLRGAMRPPAAPRHAGRRGGVCRILREEFGVELIQCRACPLVAGNVTMPQRHRRIWKAAAFFAQS
jgi:hypothetical protein